MKQLNHIAVKRKLTSTIWKQTVLVLLSIHLILIAGGRLQAQTVIDATFANTIQTELNSGRNYTVTSSLDIIVSYPITKSAGSSATLTLKAARHIYLQNGANITASSGALNLHLWADSDNSSDGINQIASNVNTNGGWLKAGNDNQTAILNSVSTRVGGDVFFNGSSPQTITTNNGQIDIYGETIVGNTSGLTINSGNGNVTLYGLLNSGNQYTPVNYLNVTWLQAQAQADADNNENTYLATITSRLENSIAALSVSYNSAWLGARRVLINSSGFWRWEKGPEALQGLTYTNWAANEPNNYFEFVSQINGLGYTGENALQFTGANGSWNDLFDNGVRTYDKLNYYVLETTLAASPVTIIAGSGTVTFKAAVGGSKPLSSLSITAATTAINGGSVTTNGSGAGSQSYSGNITLGNASTVLTMLDTPSAFTINNGKSITNLSGSHATLTIKTTAPIIMEAGSSISSSSGALNVVLWADTDANGGYIRTNSGCSITTNGGHLWMGGGSGSNTWNGLTVGNGYALGNELNSNGILIIGSSIATNGGNVALFGKSRLGAAVGNDGSAENTNVDGIRISPFASSLINSGAGSILIDGVSQGTNQVALGVEFCSLSNVTHLITSSASGDAIIITGTGSQSAGTQVNTNGVFVHNGTTISATGGGNIKITGVGGSVGSTQQATYFSEGSLVNPGSGNLTVTGNSIYLAGTFSGSGTLTIQPNTANTTIGIGGGAGTLQLPSSLFPTNFADGFSTITIGSASAGNITVSGTTTYNDPLTFKTAGNIFVSTGASLTGAPAGSDGIKSSLVFWADASANSIGGVWFQPSSSLTTNGGQIYVGGGTDENIDQLPDGYAYGTYDFIRPFNVTDYDIGSGILIEGNLNSGGGDITAWGFAPLSISHSAGVHIAHSGVVNAGGGNILLNGQSDKGAAYIRGVWIGDGVASASSAVVGTTGTGTLTITGQSAVSEDILLDASALSTEIGNITIDGDDFMLFNAGPTTNTIISGTGKVQIVSNAIAISAGTNTIRSNGELVISPKTSSLPISLGTNVVNSLNLKSTFFTDNFLDGFSQITLGSATQTGNITSTSLTFRDSMHLQTASSAKVVVTANETLTLNAGVKLTIDKDIELQTGAKIVKLTQ